MMFFFICNEHELCLLQYYSSKTLFYFCIIISLFLEQEIARNKNKEWFLLFRKEKNSASASMLSNLYRKNLTAWLPEIDYLICLINP